jgi:hypothetical protein
MKVSGEEIIQAIVEDMYEGREDLRYSVLPPGIYRVYLHEKDYKRVLPIVRHVVDEASRALDEEVDKMNGKSSSSGEGLLESLKGSVGTLRHKAESLIRGDGYRKEWKKPAEGWQISINTDPNDELQAGDLCVNSELMLPARIELGTGNPTKNLTTIRRSGTNLKSDRKYAENAQAETEESTIRREEQEPVIPAANAYALIHYQDADGKARTFQMTKGLIVIGRGGGQVDVDLVLHEQTRISREHLSLRRDEVSGKFFIKDTSKFGTKVDGVSLNGPQTTGRLMVTESSESELPARARIELAGSLEIEFQALRQSPNEA